MKILLDHFGALIAGSVVAPTVYLLVIGFQAQAAVPTPSITPSNIPTATQTPTPKPSPTSTPTPTTTPSPIPTAPEITSAELDNWFSMYSNQYSIDRQKLWSIAVCESGLNGNAKNGDYWGLYQFSSGTWRTTRTHMSLDPNPDLRSSAEESIKTAAFKISIAGAAAWPNCNK